MNWKNQLNDDPISWLLESQEPCIRYLVYRDLLDRPDSDSELQTSQKEIYQKSSVTEILDHMHPEGWWGKPGGGYGPKYYSGVWSLISLAQMGANMKLDKRIAIAASYYIDHAFTDLGQISTNAVPSYSIDCLQGNMLAALLDLSCSDPRLTKAFDWMARTATGEGVAPQSEKTNKARYYAYKCGPNFACGVNDKQSCAWGAVKVMLAFSKLPKEKHTTLIDRAIQTGVNFLLGVDPSTAGYPNGGTDHPSRNWWKFGFPVFYISDILQIVEALVGLGYSKDPRLANALKLVTEKQDSQGRWALEYHYNDKTWVNTGRGGQPNPWVTLRALRVLKKAAK